jgi:lysophospholipase L1-like esterase
VTLFFPHATEIDIDHWPSLSAFDRNLRDFVEIADRKQYRVLLATQPSLYREDLTPAEQDTLVFSISQQFQGKCASASSMRRGMEQFNAKTRQIAASLGVPLVDVEAALPKSLEYMYDDVHYTPRGNTLIGHTVAQRILELGLLPPRTSSDSKALPGAPAGTGRAR